MTRWQFTSEVFKYGPVFVAFEKERPSFLFLPEHLFKGLVGLISQYCL